MYSCVLTAFSNKLISINQSLISRPSLISRVDSVPGVSDHQDVLASSLVKAGCKRPVRRKSYLWKQSDDTSIREAMTSFAQRFVIDYSMLTPVNKLWLVFKSKYRLIWSTSSVMKWDHLQLTSSTSSLFLFSPKSLTAQTPTIVLLENLCQIWIWLKSLLPVWLNCYEISKLMKPLVQTASCNISSSLQQMKQLRPYSSFSRPLCTVQQGAILTDWVAFKKGERANPANYRPISLTSVWCKLMEHILHSSSMKHLEHQNILSNRRHGFCKKRSCEWVPVDTDS